MSKKFDLDRITSRPGEAPSASAVRRPAEPSAAAPRGEDGAVKETRVAAGVVRRRPAAEAAPARGASAPTPPPPAPPPRTIRRPAAAREEAPPAEARVEAAPAATPVVEARQEAPAPEAIVEARREEAAAPVAPVAPSAPPAPAPAPVVAAPVAPEAPAERPARPTSTRATVVSRPAGAPEPPPERPSERPRYAGLGSAVVVPPPGYDPTNPNAFRNEVERRQAADGASRGGARRQAATPQPAPQPDMGFGGGGGEDDGRGRRTRRTSPAGGFDAANLRRKSRKRVVGPKKSSPAPKAQKRKIRIDSVISVGQLAKELGIKAAQLIRQLMSMDMMVRVNDMLDFDTASLLAGEFEYEVENVGFQESDFLQHVGVEAEEEGQETRPPVVTIMGHVDHGKTTLLDAIRNARVAAGEAGGITQHIGAYQVTCQDQLITFIDTPGHAAFSSMRARGAQVTDIVILVVAADDGVQPQTEEAIAHARAAGVPIIVAVNKCDKPGVNPDTIRQQLNRFDLVPEEWGGDTLMVNVSALKGENLDGLLEAILLQAEVLDLQANSERHAEGVVIEAKMERGRGAVASLLVQKGTLKQGDQIVIGAAFGKVRAMLDDRGKPIKSAGPATPVEIFGLSELPATGDAFSVVKSEKDARTLAEHRAKSKRDLELSQTNRRTAEDLFAQAGPQNEQLQVVLKADVQGSLEALKGALQAIDVDGTELRILLAGVGPISESDVNLSGAGNCVLIGFNVKLDANARRRADELGVEPHLFEVIYGALDFVESRMKGLLAPEYEEVRQGSAEVRAVFAISRFGKVAGSMVLDGKIGRNQQARVLRDGKEVWKGQISQLKRFKDDVREVTAGYECGILLDGFEEIAVGDVIEASSLQVKARA